MPDIIKVCDEEKNCTLCTSDCESYREGIIIPKGESPYDYEKVIHCPDCTFAKQLKIKDGCGWIADCTYLCMTIVNPKFFCAMGSPKEKE